MAQRTIKICDNCNEQMGYDDVPHDVRIATELVSRLISKFTEYGVGEDVCFCSMPCLENWTMEFIKNIPSFEDLMKKISSKTEAI